MRKMIEDFLAARKRNQQRPPSLLTIGVYFAGTVGLYILLAQTASSLAGPVLTDPHVQLQPLVAGLSLALSATMVGAAYLISSSWTGLIQERRAGRNV